MHFTVRRAHDAQTRIACRTLLQGALGTEMPLFPDQPDRQTAATVQNLGGIPETVFAASDASGALVGACVLRADTEVYMIIANGLDPRIARAYISQWGLLPQLAVALEHRGQGAGRALVQAALATASLRPTIAGVYAFAETSGQGEDSDGEESVGFFTEMGFTSHGEHRVSLPILPQGGDQLLSVPISHDGSRQGRYVTKSIHRPRG